MNSLRSKGLLAIWHDVDESVVAEYLRWHSFEHLPERLRLSGFQRARRFEHVEGNKGDAQQYFCLIDVDEADVFKRSEYLALLNAPSSWTRSLMPHYHHVHRALCDVIFENGSGVGTALSCIRFNLAPAFGKNGFFPVAIQQSLLKHHAEMALTHGQIAVVNASLDTEDTSEKRLRRTEDAGGYEYLLVAGGLGDTAFDTTAAQIYEVVADHADQITASMYTLSYVADAENPNSRCGVSHSIL